MNVPAQTNLALNPAQLPAHLQHRQHTGRRLIDQLGDNLGLGSPPYLSIAGGAFTLKAPQGERRVGFMSEQLGIYLDVCIIDALEHVSKIFYTEAFTPGASDYKPPDCFSHNGQGPSIQSAVPQSTTCASCPYYAWGSAVSEFSGKGVKACQDYQHLALIIPGDPQVWLLRVPPNSLKNLKLYKDSFKNFPNVDLGDVITRIWFEPNKIGSMLFTAVDFVPADLAKYTDYVLGEKQTDAIVARNDRARDPNAPLPYGAAAQGGGQAPQQQMPQGQQPAQLPGPQTYAAPGPQTYAAPGPQTYAAPGPHPHQVDPAQGYGAAPQPQQGYGVQQPQQGQPVQQPTGRAPQRRRRVTAPNPNVPQQPGAGAAGTAGGPVQAQQHQAPFVQPQQPQQAPQGFTPGPAPGYPQQVAGGGQPQPMPAQGGAPAYGAPQPAAANYGNPNPPAPAGAAPAGAAPAQPGQPAGGWGMSPGMTPNADVAAAISSVVGPPQ